MKLFMYKVTLWTRRGWLVHSIERMRATMRPKNSLILLIAMAGWATCATSYAETIIGSTGAAYQSWGSNTLNNNQAPFWDFATKYGPHLTKNVGYILSGTGDGAGVLTHPPGNIPFWGMSYNSAKDTDGHFDPAFFFKRASSFALKATLEASLATQSFELNAFGWFETDSAGSGVGVKHQLFAGEPDRPDPVGTTVFFPPTPYYGYYFYDGSEGCPVTTLTPDKCGTPSTHTVWAFSTDPYLPWATFWIAGLNGPTECIPPGNDCNQTLVKVETPPVLGAPIYVAHNSDHDVVMFNWKGDLIADLNFNKINKDNNPDHLDLNFTKDDAIATGDVNGDGLDEIVIAHNDPDRIDIFNKSGLLIGHFTAAHGFNRGNGFAVGDVKGFSPGVAEILIAHQDAHTINIFNASGLESQISGRFDDGDGFAVGDINGDGTAEILVANRDKDRIEIFDVSGNKVPGIPASFDAEFILGNGFAVGDLDGDKRAEILIAHPNDSIIKIFKLLPDGTFPPEKDAEQIATTFNTGNGFAVGDVDSDGKGEILVAHQNTNGDGNIQVFDRGTLRKSFDGDFNPNNGFAVGHIDRDNNRNITGSLSIVRGKMMQIGGSRDFIQQVTLTNISADPISGAISLVLDDMNVPNPTFVNATGATVNSPPTRQSVYNS